MSRDYFLIAAAVALKRQSTGDLFEASKRQSTGDLFGESEKGKLKKSNERNIILSRDYFLIAAAVALKRQSTWDLFEASKRLRIGDLFGKSEKGKLKKSNERNIILSRDYFLIAAAVALKRQSTGDLFEASKRQSTGDLFEASKRLRTRDLFGKRKIKKLNEQNIILSRDYFLIAAAVALKRQSTWDLFEASKRLRIGDLYGKSEKGKLKNQTNKILFCHVIIF